MPDTDLPFDKLRDRMAISFRDLKETEGGNAILTYALQVN